MRADAGYGGAAAACVRAALGALRERPCSSRELLLRQLSACGDRIVFGEAPGVDTAAMIRSQVGDELLVVNRQFLEQQVQDGTDALWVIAHELFHRVLGDLHRRLDEALGHPLANFACDLAVNARLAWFVLPEGAGISARLYDPLRFPENLLLPPAQLLHGFARHGVHGAQEWALPPAAIAQRIADDEVARRLFERALVAGFRLSGCPAPRQAAELYRWIWIELMSLEVFVGTFQQLVQEHFPTLALVCVQLPFVSDHNGFDPGSLEGEGLPNEVSPFGGRGDCADDVIRDEKPPDEYTRAVFYDALLRALDLDPRQWSMRPDAAETRSVLLGQSRRDLVLLASGWYPMLFHATAPGLDDESECAHVYLDVSGSTDEYQPLMLGLLAHGGERIAVPLHLFSNLVFDASLDELSRGLLRTTGGTDFDCVIEHALKHRYRRILLVTDGLAEVSDANAAAARRAGLRIVALQMGMHVRDAVLRRMGATCMTVPWLE